ncbi:hypothetical protein KXD93_01470 [Mucilaginibacter sp. BJC16-A38]|uniref:hypothetical protein n=1 Tax=Mucilaginibacter phenanthrenivorans TaxID=1234842 RepID=UPI002157C3B5|nr:hypothetical protein [Mucilaginibacter phenanthrenivorans]MCR8556289.1 hypothetical protein [Mucilaginibacter phenanthrenivorans]
MSIFNPISLNKQFEVNGSAGSIDNYISKNEPHGFSAHKVSKNEYKFLSDLSLGTLIKNRRPGSVNGIHTKVVITPVNKDKAIVNLESKSRFELILIIVLWAVILLLQLVAKQPVAGWITAILFPALLVFFFLLHRIQVNVLQSKVERYLKQYNAISAKNK